MKKTQKHRTFDVGIIYMILSLVLHLSTFDLSAQTCDYYEGDFSFNSQGGNNSSKYTTKFLLVNQGTNTIEYISDSTSFQNVLAGSYNIYAVNYSKKYGIIGLNLNEDFADLRALCSDISAPLPIRICSYPEITIYQSDTSTYCIGTSVPLLDPNFNIEERDGDSLELHITLASGGDPLRDTLNVDLSAFSYAIKYFSFPTLIIRADVQNSGSGIALSDALTILQTLTLGGTSPLAGVRTVEIQAFDTNSNSSNIVTLYFEAIDCKDCTSIFSSNSEVRFQEDCIAPYDFCLNILRDSVQRYAIYDNGQPVTQIADCHSDTNVIYSYLSMARIPGPFEIKFWNVGDGSFRSQFNDFDELAGFMQAWDALGTWANDESNFTIIGPKNRPTYGDLEIRHLLTGKIWSLSPNYSIQSNNFISIPLTVGDHEIVLVDLTESCSDTMQVSIICDDAVTYVPESFGLFDTIQVSIMDSLCLTRPGIKIKGIYNECEPSSGEFVRFGLSKSCITFEGVEVGLDSFCVVACGPIGDCDTTTLYVTVIPEIFDPIANNDTSSTLETVPAFIDILANDTLNNGILTDIQILNRPQYGSVTLDPNNNHIAEYIPRENFCGWMDSFTYVIANQVGQDTATVFLDMLCDSLRVLNGFSPNGDGINDVFVILGIENIEKNRVTIYNRWGNIVFKKENYRNQEGWDGTWAGDELPDGTYFYTIEDKPRHIIKSGWVQLHRG